MNDDSVFNAKRKLKGDQSKITFYFICTLEIKY